MRLRHPCVCEHGGSDESRSELPEEDLRRADAWSGAPSKAAAPPHGGRHLRCLPSMSNWQDIGRQSQDTKEALELPAGPGGAGLGQTGLSFAPETTQQ